MKPLELQHRRPAPRRAVSALRLLAAQWMALLWIGGLAVPAQEPPASPDINQPPAPAQEPSAGSETNQPIPTPVPEQGPSMASETNPPPGSEPGPPMNPDASQPPGPEQEPAANADASQPAVAARKPVASPATNPAAISDQKPAAVAETNRMTVPARKSDRRARNNRPAAPEEEAAAGPGTNELAFKIIYERNIFNPNRGPRYSRRTEGDAPKPAKVDGFSLVGTLLSDKGAYAFFDGTEARYRAALKTSNTIAGYTVTAITPNFVTLRTPSNAFDLTMNMQMRRQEEGDWELTETKGSWNTTNAASSTDAAAAASDGEGGNDPSADEVMKRLMKKREEELKK